MPDRNSNVQLRIKARNETRAVLNTLKRRLEKTRQQIERINAGVRTAVIAIGAAIGAATFRFASFDRQMSLVGVTIGANVEQMARLREAAENAGATTEKSASEAAQALRFMALAGYDTEQAISSLDGVIKLSILGETDLKTASDLLTDAMSSFGLEARETSRVVDQWVKIQASANTNVEQLGTALINIRGQAGLFGATMEQTASALAVLANTGIKAQAAGTALRQMFAQLSKSDVRDKLFKVGVEVADASGKFRDLADIIRDVQVATEGKSEADRAAIFALIGNARAQAAFTLLAQGGHDALIEYEQAQINALGATDDMIDTLNNDAMGSLNRIKSALDAMVISLGSSFAPALSSVADSLGRLAVWLSKNRDMVVSFGEGLLFAFKVLISFYVIGKITTLFLAFRTALIAVRATMIGVASTASVMYGALTFGLSAAIPLIIQHWDKIKSVFINGVNTIIGWVNKLIGAWNKLPTTTKIALLKVVENVNIHHDELNDELEAQDAYEFERQASKKALIDEGKATQAMMDDAESISEQNKRNSLLSQVEASERASGARKVAIQTGIASKLSSIASSGAIKSKKLRKAAALTDVGIGLATQPQQAFAQAMAAYPPPIGQILGGISAALTTIQLLSARSQVSGFAKGGIVSSPQLFSHGGELGVVGESVSNPYEAIMPLGRDDEGNLGVRGKEDGVQVINLQIDIDGESIARRVFTIGSDESVFENAT